MAAEARRCAERHNQILGDGWHVNSMCFISFWERHVQNQADIEELVVENVVAFYRAALVLAGTTSTKDPYQNFFYYLRGLARPWDADDFHRNQMMKLNGGSGSRYLLLYATSTAFGNQRGGIVLDQESGQASIQADLASMNHSAMVWKPLSTILTSYIDMISLGKVTSANLRSISRTLEAGKSDIQDAWTYHSYSPEILTRTLAAYHGLIAAIEAVRDESAMFEDERVDDYSMTVYLSTPFNLDAANFPKTCFIRSFLSRARRPRGPRRIRYIAPGIELPSAKSIHFQPFKALARLHQFAGEIPGLPSVRDEEGSNPLYPPFLLFPADSTRHSGSSGREKSHFAAPFNELEDCPAGLWLDRTEPWSGRGGEDEAVIVSPFQPPRQGHISCSAGVNLYAILESWTLMVKSGRWKVDERGVVGSIELLACQEHGNDEARGRSLVRESA